MVHSRCSREVEVYKEKAQDKALRSEHIPGSTIRKLRNVGHSNCQETKMLPAESDRFSLR